MFEMRSFFSVYTGKVPQVFPFSNLIELESSYNQIDPEARRIIFFDMRIHNYYSALLLGCELDNLQIIKFVSYNNHLLQELEFIFDFLFQRIPAENWAMILSQSPIISSYLADRLRLNPSLIQ